MKTKTIKIYSASELSEDAQQRAYENWLQTAEYGWGEENRQTLEAFEKIFPIDVKNFDYSNRSDINWKFTETDEIENLSGQRLANYIWNNYKNQIFKGKYFSTDFKKCKVDSQHPAGITYKKRYSRIMLENSCVLTGYCIDDDILKEVYNLLDQPNLFNNTTFKDLMETCLNNWLTACQNDYEGCSTMEYFLDSAEANECEFDENGERI